MTICLLFKVRRLIAIGLCAVFLLGGCGGQSTITSMGAPDIPPDIESALHYIKASNTGNGDNFGHSIAMSADGTTLAIGAPRESSDAVGANKIQVNDDRPVSGAVYVFVRSGKTWVQQAYIKASNPDPYDLFGTSVALSANGHTLAVGATDEDSSVGSDPYDNNAFEAGAVYVFARDGVQWSQQDYLKAELPRENNVFGSSIALSGDGHLLAVGSPQEDSGGAPPNADLPNSGAVHIFKRTGVSWSQTALLKASNASQDDGFGSSVSLSTSGDTLAVGADFRSGGSDPGDNLPNAAGAAYVFKRTNDNWSEVAYLKASNPGEFYNFGYRVAVSADGLTLAVAAIGEASSATTINDPNGELNNDIPSAGAVYVFNLSAGVWGQQFYIKASNAGHSDLFGISLAISSDGSTMMVGARSESSKAVGINGEQGDNSATLAGAVYVFTRSTDTWSQRAYVKSSNTDAFDRFGSAVAMSGDGRTFAAGAPGEASKATGIDGDQFDNAMPQAGAVYVLNTLN
ncbi:integrin [Hydrogenophaga sp.]|uniref:integrin n=1 Tax=Hydrogenophaga sp. TaxID=1904254 RepID=UPI002717C1F7|nr:integrin [Hydrogenophaga sp.]MDO9435069.1 integrin [Hydrogenophaga sp.]